MSNRDALPLTETVAPSDQAGVAEAVKAAAAGSRAMFPIGGGTRQDYGARPTREGVGLSLGRLNRVVDYQPDDMTITVEAGVTLAELARQLDRHEQRLPVDVPHPNRSTIGGAAAVNLVGPRRFAYGTLRDYVLGVKAVDGRGQVFAGGGRVVKNAAGLNTHRLLVGSLGSLGVVTQLTLMVRPKPELAAVVNAEVADLASAERLFGELVHSEARPVAVELLSGVAASTTSTASAAAGAPHDSLRLVVGFEGPKVEVQAMVDRLSQQWRDAGMRPTLSITTEGWATLVQPLIDFEADLQVNVLPSRVVATVDLLRNVEPQGAVVAHAGDGVVLLRLKAREPDDAAQALRELRPAVERSGGRMTVLRSPSVSDFSIADVWGEPRDGAAVSQAIKQYFDPFDVLNPGRFSFSPGHPKPIHA